MIALLPAILLSSLVGSLHCIAMCGPLLGLHGPSSVRLAFTHSLGRLVTYVALGAVAGTIGHAIDLAARLGTTQRVASIVAALAIVVWGVHGLVTRRGLELPGNGTTFRRGLVQIRSAGATRRAWATGLLTGLLPCGWLWAFVVTAGGTGTPWTGAAVMAAFWLGTVPAMVGVLAFAGPLIGRLRARIPTVTAIALIAVGLGTLAVRWRDAGADQVAHPHCHEPQS
jgi:sulfite exporter TauE/SafE